MFKMKSLKNKNNFFYNLVILSAPSISYLILGPLEFFFGNQKDLTFKVTDFVWILVGISVCFCCVGSLFLMCLDLKISKWINSFILGFSICSYIQNMIMNIKLSEIDGVPLRWDTLGHFPFYNTIIWGVVLFIVVFISFTLKKYWNQISIGIAAFLSVIQLTAVFSLLIFGTHSENNEYNNLQMSGAQQFEIAPNHNIIVFVLDTFGNTQLENALQIYPELLDEWNDFTFYDNADCHYYCTFPSMTHMLTGEEFDFNAFSEEWMSDAWTSPKCTEFYQILEEMGYSRYLFSHDIHYVYGDIENLQSKYDNIIPMEQIVNHKKITKLMIKMSFFKYFPYILKAPFEVLTPEFSDVVSYKDGIVPIYKNSEFLKALSSKKLSINKDINNALIIQHLWGTHEPYETAEDGTFLEDASVEQTVSGLVKIVNEYIAQLKLLNMYDSSTIIITADHGSWHNGDPQPIYFIKKNNEIHDSMQVNSSPISADDFQATILSILDQNYSDYGTSIFDWNEEDIRERKVYMRMNDTNLPEVQGSSFNAYYGYSYSTNKKEVVTKIEESIPDEILPATPWIN